MFLLAADIYIADTKSEPSMYIHPRGVAVADSHLGTEYSVASSKSKRSGRRGDFAL